MTLDTIFRREGIIVCEPTLSFIQHKALEQYTTHMLPLCFLVDSTTRISALEVM